MSAIRIQWEKASVLDAAIVAGLVAVFVVISGERVSEQRMAMLDRLIDDGNLETGVFQRRGSRYHYTIKDSVL